MEMEMKISTTSTKPYTKSPLLHLVPSCLHGLILRILLLLIGGRLKVVGRAGVGIDNVDLSAATEHGCLVVNAPTANTIAAAEHGIDLPTAMARNIAQADVSMKAGGLLYHCRLNFALCDQAFSQMKKGVRIVNVARGGVIDEEALVRALDSGIAALDVFTVEPPPKDSRLVLHENVTVTPHLGASTAEAQEGVAIEVAEAVVGALKGELAATAVNTPMVPAELKDCSLSAFEHGVEDIVPFAHDYLLSVRRRVRMFFSSDYFCSLQVQMISDTWMLHAMITKGLIEPFSSVFINLVNADFTAKQRGLRITEEHILLDGSPENPLELIQVQIANVESKFATAISDSGEIKVEGRVKDRKPHLTMIGSFGVDASMEGNLILCRQVDQPGMIGSVGNILGEENVNVSFMSVGRITP
ncbi:hypothetical protein OIU78_011966 [Salix suchowensis]|nr:hypothetical protein OIU78_011966 [Salix suchowensis]